MFKRRGPARSALRMFADPPDRRGLATSNTASTTAHPTLAPNRLRRIGEARYLLLGLERNTLGDEALLQEKQEDEEQEQRQQQIS